MHLSEKREIFKSGFLSRAERAYVTVLLLSIAPVLIAIYPSIPFFNDGSCDNWALFGTFYHFPDATYWPSPDAFDEPRQLARLTQVIPGYLLTKALNGVGADYAMFFIYYCTAVLFFQQTARILINEKVALFGTIIFAVHPLIIGNYSATFASPAITYCIISLYLVGRCLQVHQNARKLGLLFGSGVAMGAAIHVHLAVVVFGIANYLVYLFYEMFYSPETLRARISHLFQAGFVVAAAMTGFTLALGSLAVLLGGHFSLVLQQFFFLRYEFSDSAKEWVRQDWYFQGGVVGILLAALVLSAINIYMCSLVKGVALPESVRQRVSAVSWAILVLVFMLFIYNELGGAVIQYDYYYVFFIPYFCLVLFSLLLFVETGNSRTTLVRATVFLIFCLSATSLNEDILGWLHDPPIEAIASVALAICAGLTYAYLTLSGRTGAGLSGFYMALVILMLATIRPEWTGAGIWTSQRNLGYATEYQRIRAGLALLNGVHFTKYPKFWLDAEDGSSELISYPQSYFSCVFQKSFPTIDQELWSKSRHQFIPGDDVVIISKQPSLHRIADAAFAALGLVTNVTADFTVGTGRDQYELLVERVASRRPPAGWYKWLLDGKPPLDSDEINDAYVLSQVSGSNTKEGFPVEITTPSQPWAYGAKFEPRIEDRRGPLWVRVQLNVQGGPIGIGILNQDGSSFLTRTSVIDSGDMTLTLRVSQPEFVGDLVIETWDRPIAANVRIDAITVLKLPRSTIEALFGKPPA